MILYILWEYSHVIQVDKDDSLIKLKRLLYPWPSVAPAFDSLLITFYLFQKVVEAVWCWS